jgi:sugar/nucleoside kinase (ribokinase family)
MSGGVGTRGVICAGRFYVDLVFTAVPAMPTPGTETYAGGFAIHPGGGAFITAAWLAALGRRSGLLSRLPEGPFGDALAPAMAGFGVDLSLCPRAGPPQVTAAINVGEDRAFLTHRHGPALPPVTAASLRGARHLHIGELATLAEAPELAASARAAGLTVSLDCAWDEAALDRPDRLALIGSADVFLPNEIEAERLGLAALAALPRTLTVVKEGARGSRVLRPEGPRVPAAPVTPVDTTGAGDAYAAGFIDAWLDGAPLDRCLAEGNRCGGRAVSAAGGTGALSG